MKMFIEGKSFPSGSL